MRNLPNTWSIFVPFPEGTLLVVADGDRVVGHGVIAANAGGRLVVHIRMRDGEELALDAEYHQEGAGNLVTVRRRGQSLQDADAVIDSEEEHRRRRVRAHAGNERADVTLCRDGDDVTFEVDGRALRLRRLRPDSAADSP